METQSTPCFAYPVLLLSTALRGRTLIALGGSGGRAPSIRREGERVVGEARRSCFLDVSTHPLQFYALIVQSGIAAQPLPRHRRTTRREKAAFMAKRCGD